MDEGAVRALLRCFSFRPDRFLNRMCRRLGRFLALVLVLLAWTASSPRTVFASCGDYLLHGTGGMMGSHAESPHANAANPADDSPQRPLPCRGPHCSRGSLPLGNSPTRVVVSADQWLCLFRAVEVDGPRAMSLPADSDAEYDFQLATRLERPPR